jgi:adenine-specific DNA-methyltransferase
MSALERLQGLFRELFQLDVADLDFGIYRLLHLKRKEVEAFLTKDLPAVVDQEFKAAAGAEQAAIEKDLKELADRIRQDIGLDALKPIGEPAPMYANAKLVRDYVAKRKQLEAIEASEAQKAEVFNHLYTFFRRYYDEGDFIPRRFYGSRESYAVPYNGEEVLFHWANKDQHYVKTGEVFRDYTFKIETLLGTFTVRFKLAQATTAKDNTKGDVRFFFALPKDADYDKAAKVFVVPFEYRLPTEAEVQRYGSGTKGQNALIVEAAKKILVAAPDDGLKSELAKVVDVRSPDDPAKREEVTLLLKRLRHFTRKNTTDYFIHKNLGGFLRQELEFYIKDQVVQAADLEGDFDAKRRMLRVFRALAERVIAFLHQIEDAQRRLFEKKKFVLRTDYLVPIRIIPRDLWHDVLANRRQVAAWKELLAIEPKRDLFNKEGAVNEQFLQEHPTLVVNTAHFEPAFALRFLGGFEGLDESTDGIVINAENYQALQLLGARYVRGVSTVFIDPPYNTGADGFIYKDRYQHSTWLAMMRDRVGACRRLLAPHAVFATTIDFVEAGRLRLLFDAVLGPDNFLADCAWEKRYTRSNNAKLFYSQKDTVLCYRGSEALTLLREARSAKSRANYTNPDNDPRGDWISSSYVNPATKEQRPNLVYKIKNPHTGEKVEHPTNAWKYDYEIHLEHVRENRLYWGLKGEYQFPRLKSFWSDAEGGMVPVDFWHYEDTGTTDEGGAELKALFGSAVFDNPKPTALIERVLRLSSPGYDGQGVLLDFFAGSGSAGHAAIDVNRTDGRAWRFLLVEVAEQSCERVIVPRIQKVMYSPVWKDGRPDRPAMKDEVARAPRLVKVLRLESYEDALHNVAEAEARGRTEEKAEAVRATAGEERYRLNYLVRLPLEASDTMLNVEKLEHPFSYTIEVLTDDGPREQTVDLVETFDWLYGLRVKRLLTWDATQGKGARTYRVVVATDRDAHKRILVVWRDMTDLDPRAERAFLEAEVASLGDFEEKWINGDCAVPGFASLDGLFKRLMEHEA